MPGSTHAADTIVAIATPAGAGGVGIVRLSGPQAHVIAGTVCARTLRPRQAHYVRFREQDGAVIDDGLALLFAAPASYTGEDVVELQAHGSPVVLQQLLARCRALGARLARPGEFSERAFLNGRLDLAQAEAVADLIAAGDLRAARAARRSLDGVFSARCEAIAAELLHLRVHVEAMIDFSDEPIDALGGDEVARRIARVADAVATLEQEAERGRKLRDGLHVVIVGPPNAGKSSLLNALAGSERAIVTDIAGTTRDLLQETLRIDGAELTLVDTAGLREAGDAIEREGMRRARAELQRADLALVVVDARDPAGGLAAVADDVAAVGDRLLVHNKIDLASGRQVPDDALAVSARTGAGLDALRAALQRRLGAGAASEGAFTARQRHVDALRDAAAALDDAGATLRGEALELTAEALRVAHDAIGTITGRVGADDLLGHIFSSFCIGK
ncbi:tRNA uridine-5-carboxymethylaminomethyl(34) synthesis GTPase MnmE [Luteimonas sp BLCC-B24]|uniref:tRNA uridine-5-carboxymethylaminomethyl(34) synthesis GTPase MnmE n=1 Tax=Luteimonas sp. BLCC-B24 TaxID=3025317 RepID=UPI00234D9C55|nr:tRNA uridine-5-carboxymethylaminomethyl(34) synthesis GTPase MnmE [Luteimonas sp. BLCC-B24]MDC7806860.1 tRNA uridine-5-carboxymethylaminomethyl(34) synthesis GTPase MnmE [Luteimonas sp. BLCC-B24]